MVVMNFSKYKFYRVIGLPPGLFGLTYVLAVAVQTSPDRYKGEFYLITSRKPDLQYGSFKISAFDFPEEFPKLDMDFVIGEALDRAEMLLFEKIEDKSKEINVPDLLALQWSLQECPSPFVGFRLRDQFKAEIVEIRNETESDKLNQYLGLVLEIKPTR